jgi:hypothetical protein
MLNALAARRVYDLERELPNRNYAKDHSFEEWYAHNFERGSQ